jgi:hypothetical protein
MIQYEYLRDFEKWAEGRTGSRRQSRKYGMAAGTDTHTGLVSAEEDNFFGKLGAGEPGADRWKEDALKFGPDRIVKGWEMTAAGYTAVWATGNTRAEIWDAMKRRETYATSGPHMVVRFFGGYDFTKADISRTPSAAGYEKGVAMGSDLKAARAARPQRFDSSVEGPRRKSGSHSDHQGLAGQIRQATRRFGLVLGRQTAAHFERKADACRKHRGCGTRDVDEYYRVG